MSCKSLVKMNNIYIKVISKINENSEGIDKMHPNGVTSSLVLILKDVHHIRKTSVF